MKIYALLLFLLSISGCVSENKMESEAPDQAIEGSITTEAEEDPYYDYASMDDVLALEVNEYDCRYFVSRIVQCEFKITNPNDRPVYDLFVIFLPIDESGEEGEFGVSNTSGNRMLESGESGTITATLTTIPPTVESLRFIIETNEKPYQTNMEDFDLDDLEDN